MRELVGGSFEDSREEFSNGIVADWCGIC